MELKEMIRSIPDYPEKGVIFRDITTLLKDGEGFQKAIDELTDLVRDWEPDVIVGMEARGFIVGAPVAYALGCGFVPVRKPGKLPYDKYTESYELEYGTDSLEIHKDGIEKGQKVVIIDDLLATGGTSKATISMVEKSGGKVMGLGFLIELNGLKGREEIQEYDVKSIIKYD
ncbi:MAG: adenine phosphoribosyltransferase [Tissierellia bacterium]|nr:adenine phosphoribosyltransferase [Tissierellia bacterium]